MSDTQLRFVGAIDCLADPYRSGDYDAHHEAHARQAWDAMSTDERREAVARLGYPAAVQVARRLFGVPG